jgi:hypothetical protein
LKTTFGWFFVSEGAGLIMSQTIELKEIILKKSLSVCLTAHRGLLDNAFGGLIQALSSHDSPIFFDL